MLQKLTQKPTQLAIALFVFVFLILSVASRAQAASFVTVTSPNGGEAYTEGDDVQIRWNSDAAVPCSIYYITPEGGPYMAYYVGYASSSAGFMNWTASKPSADIVSQQEKIQISCMGLPTDYSDNYFTVMSPVPTPTATPTPTLIPTATPIPTVIPTATPTPTLIPTATPTPTPAPICDLKAIVSFTNTATASAFRGQAVNNEVKITNPNDPACGSRVYGISRGYPGGWVMDLPLSAIVAAGSTEYVPLTLTSSNDASYTTYNYSVYVGDSSGGVLVGATNFVTIIPRCDATVQASLSTTSNSSYAGSTVSNNLILTNPNPVECSSKTYVYSQSYPGGWSLSIQPNVNVAGGATVSVPFGLTVSSAATVGSYGYNFWVYSAWADGSGQASVGGNVNVLDNTAPTVNITNPVNNSKVTRNRTIAISASATDNVGVTKVEFYVNGALKCTDTSTSYSCSFVTVNRKNVVYTLVAKAYDAAGNSKSDTSTVTTQ